MGWKAKRGWGLGVAGGGVSPEGIGVGIIGGGLDVIGGAIGVIPGSGSGSGFEAPGLLLRTLHAIGYCYSWTGSGYLYKSSAVYATAREAADADGHYHNGIGCGQQKNAVYRIDRGGLYFNTGAYLPSDAKVKSVTLKLVCYVDRSDLDFLVIPVCGDDLDGHNLVNADYGDLFDETFAYGSWTTEDFVQDTQILIPLNAAFYPKVALLTAAPYTKVGLRSLRDIDGDVPTGDEVVYFYAAETGKYPYLTVTYTSESLG